MFQSIKLFFISLYYLRTEQLYYTVYYSLREKFRDFVNFKYRYNLYRKGLPLNFEEYIPINGQYNANTFTFLNQSVKFNEIIDWEYPDKGKLWTNHLLYFDYLLDEKMTKERGSALIYLLNDKLPSSKIAIQPYSISVRGINWIKFISKHQITRKTIDRYLYCQYRILLDNLAYDRLGNHLLENGFSMLFGAYYFKGFELFNEAKIVLTKELWEQILPDGGHYQLSPMYHQIMLNRVLDCYNLMKNNDVFHDAKLKDLLRTTAQKMLGWLEQMTYQNGDVPCMNDSAYGIAPTSAELFAYAERLGVKKLEVKLKESGYRKLKTEYLEAVVDVGKIGPDYQTTHAHSDTFNFELHYKGEPFMVETGVSTYSSNNIRLKERSTFSHNTVRYNNIEQTEVIGSFYVGRRAKTKIVKDEPKNIIATHDGYKKWKVLHQREFNISDSQFQIDDTMIHDFDEIGKSSAFFHFHPNQPEPKMEGDVVSIGDCMIYFEGADDIKILDYKFALGFNKSQSAKMLEVTFENLLKTSIVFKG